jgi:hypothetical protein
MTKSIEELLKLVNERPKTGRKQREDHSDVLAFIREFGVEPGTQAVPNYLIFYIYRSVWGGDSKKKAKKITFFQTFGKHLPDYRHGKQRFYMIKEGLFNVNEEVLKAARIYDKQHWQAKKVSKKVSALEQGGGETAP